MTRQFTLKKHEKLKSQKQLDKLFAAAESKFKFPFKLLFIKEIPIADDWPLQFGISVPKKKVKSAVKRNLIKRRTREAYRLNKTTLQQQLLGKGNFKLSLMFIFIGNEPVEYQIIENSIKYLLSQLLKEVTI